MKETSPACTRQAENASAKWPGNGQLFDGTRSSPRRSNSELEQAHGARRGEPPSQVRNFRRFNRRALELAGRLPWLAFLSLRCVFDMTSLNFVEKHGSF